MSIQRLVLAVLFVGFSAASALAQTSPLNLNKVTRVNNRVAAAPQHLPPTTSEAFDAGTPSAAFPNFFELLFGGLRPTPMPQYQRNAALTVQPEYDGTDRPPLDTKFLPQQVGYNGPEKPGTVVIDTQRRFLFLVLEDRQAMRYGIGVGRPGFTWAGVKQVSSKREWPDWIPPEDMLRRRPDLPHFMAGGRDNPLGARAIYLGSSLYRIHGSNEPWTIGHAVSSGCIRMRNEDVIELYERVKVGTKVVVI
jgi:lipoprotein-anchoring transpeptidase ErfK/SrfK